MKFMQGLVAGIVATLIGAVALYMSGIFAVSAPTPESAAVPAERRIDYWVAPMDPSYRRDGPGKSPMGMDLIPVYEGEGNTGYEGVEIDPRLVASIGVKTMPVLREVLTPTVRTIGQFTYDERLMEHVHVRASGWVEKLYVRAAGEPVTVGQALFDVYAPDLLSAGADYIQALGTGERVYIEGAMERLRGLGMTAADIEKLHKAKKLDRLLTIRAPRSGVIHKMNIGDGDRVQVGSPAMSVVDLSKMWLIANVFEADLPHVREGAKVRVTPHAAEGRLTGEVDYIYPDLDETTRTARVRIVLDNPEGALKISMYADVSINRPALEGVLTVPSSALIRLGRGTHVMVAEGDGRYRPTQVTAGAEIDGVTVITDGLSEGQEVVVRGQFMIDSEASFQGAQMRMLMDGNDDMAEEDSAGMGSMDMGPLDEDTVEGTINEVMLEEGKLNISHGPMENFGMPGMTMDFPVAEGVGIGEGLEGARVRLTVKREGMSFTIIRLDVLEAAQ